jgi:flagellar motor switch protein FliG
MGQRVLPTAASSGSSELSGIERAAVSLRSLGRDEAAAILKNLDSKDVEAIGIAMTRLPSLPEERAAPIIQSFLDRTASGGELSGGSQDYIRELLVTVFGKQRPETILDRILAGESGGTGLEALEGMDPRAIARIVSDEHPQIIAALLAQLDGGLAAKVVMLFSEALRADIVMRVARIQEMPQAAIFDLDRIVAELVARGPRTKWRRIGGAGSAADIINGVDRDCDEALLGAIEVNDTELHGQIKDPLLVFEHLIELENDAIQRILREVSDGILATALRGATAACANKIFANMSKRAADILREDMEARGPIRVSEVEAAQREILSVALKLAEEGLILIGRSATDYV